MEEVQCFLTINLKHPKWIHRVNRIINRWSIQIGINLISIVIIHWFLFVFCPFCEWEPEFEDCAWVVLWDAALVDLGWLQNYIAGTLRPYLTSSPAFSGTFIFITWKETFIILKVRSLHPFLCKSWFVLWFVRVFDYCFQSVLSFVMYLGCASTLFVWFWVLLCCCRATTELCFVAGLFSCGLWVLVSIFLKICI